MIQDSARALDFALALAAACANALATALAHANACANALATANAYANACADATAYADAYACAYANALLVRLEAARRFSKQAEWAEVGRPDSFVVQGFDEDYAEQTRQRGNYPLTHRSMIGGGGK